MIERTYIMIKPGFLNLGGEIAKRIEKAGLKIVRREERSLNRETLQKHYAEHLQKAFYPELELYMLSGPVGCMIVEGENAVGQMRKLIGPTKDAEKGTIRGDYSINVTKNVIHGSDSAVSAQREIGIFFPGE